jgi:hypothetical protein
MSSKKQTLKQINNIEDLQQDPFNANEVLVGMRKQ